MKKFITFLFLVFITFTIYAEIAPDTILTPDSDITLGKLPNGLTYYIRPNSYPENRVFLRLVVKSGSVMEDDDQLGLAHFFEHMAFNGTEKYPGNQVIDFLEKNGIQFGPEINAYTSYDRTVFMLEIPSDKGQLVDQSIEVLSQWAAYVKLEPQDIDDERGVVIEEWRRNLGAEERLREFLLDNLLKGSRFALRNPIGKVEILETFTRDQLVRYYKEWYTPDRMAVMVIGDVKADTVKNSIEKYFSPLKNNPKQRTIDMTVPINSGTITGIKTDPEATENQFDMCIKVPFQQNKIAGDYREYIVRILFCNMMSDRFDQLKRSQDPPFMSAGLGFSQLFSSVNLFNLAVNLKDDGVKEGIECACNEVARVKQHGFTPTELERAKAELLSLVESLHNEKDKTNSSNIINEYTRNFMEDEPIPGIDTEYELYCQYLPLIQLEEVNSYVQNYLKKDGRVIVATGKPQSFEGISESFLQNLVDSALSSEQNPYEDLVLQESLIDAVPAAGKIKSARTDKKTGLTTLKLSNGAKVLLYPTTFKNDQILISAISEGGTSLVSDSQWASAAVACAVVNNSGLGSFSRVELDQMLKGKNVAVSPFIETYSEGFTGSSSKKDIETAFQLIHLYFTAPRFDQEAYNTYMTRLETAVKNQETSPDTAFIKALKELVTQNHPRGRTMDMEVYKEISFQNVQDVYKARFADPGDFSFILVGNIDIEAAKELASTYIASIPSSGSREKWMDVGIRVPAGKETASVYKGTDFRSQVLTIMKGKFRFSAKEDLYIDALAYFLNPDMQQLVVLARPERE
ncbi:MAG: insulinase family protein [Spirochaetia bacterium]|nr:insulinase family protein [Spirochaetia bacterium]